MTNLFYYENFFHFSRRTINPEKKQKNYKKWACYGEWRVSC